MNVILIQPKKSPARLLRYAGMFLAAAALHLQAGTDDDKSMAPPAVQQPGPDNSSIWNQQYLLGDWGGERSALEKQGVTFDFNDIGDFQADVSGNQEHHASYFGRVRGSVDLDLKKLVDVDAEFFVTGIYQYGRNESGDYLHTNTLTSSIAGVESARVDQIWYKQWFFNHHSAITFGQVAAVNEFGATDFFDILFNDELGYAPNTIFPTRQPFSPAGKPGVILWQDLSAITPGLYIKGGVFTGYDNPYRPDEHGTDYGDDFDHGVSASAEIGYKEKDTTYLGTYKIGANYGSGAYVNADTGEIYQNDYNIYGIVEKTVYHPSGEDGKVDIKRGLDLLFEAVGEPGDRNTLQYEAEIGGRYTGFFPGRDNDKIGFGVIYSDNSNSDSQAFAAVNGRGLTGETTLELDYQYNPAPWLSIQPDVQEILDAGGDTTRAPITVLALRTIVHF
jgi:porin